MGCSRLTLSGLHLGNHWSLRSIERVPRKRCLPRQDWRREHGGARRGAVLGLYRASQPVDGCAALGELESFAVSQEVLVGARLVLPRLEGAPRDELPEAGVENRVEVAVEGLRQPARQQGRKLLPGDPRQAVDLLVGDDIDDEPELRGIRHNDAIPLEDYPDHLIKAALATEDRRFYDHFGIDPSGLARALTANARAGGVVQGGSTISQQLAKNLFLSNERTIERKVKEAFLAIWLETRLTKNEILKLYLDRAYMGGGTFGVDGAAHFYFNKSARDVTLAEAAMLAGLFKAPTKYAPHINLPAARARANVVLDNLVDAGFMTEGQVFGARRNPAFAVDRRDEASPNYYLDYAFDEMRKLVDTFPKSYTERVFVVRLAIDTNVQKAAEDAIENQLRQFGRDYHATQAATVVSDLDGGIRAMVGGRDYGASQFNRATDAYRQPGSSFKPYVYTTALLNGYKPTSIVVDGPVCIGNWCPQNYGHSYSGSVTLTQAITRSINVVPVKLSIAMGGKTPNPAKAGRVKITEVARRERITQDGG